MIAAYSKRGAICVALTQSGEAWIVSQGLQAARSFPPFHTRGRSTGGAFAARGIASGSSVAVRLGPRGGDSRRRASPPTPSLQPRVGCSSVTATARRIEARKMLLAARDQEVRSTQVRGLILFNQVSGYPGAAQGLRNRSPRPYGRGDDNNRGRAGLEDQGDPPRH